MNGFPDIGKLLLILGLAIALAGLAIMFWDKLPFGRIPLGRLPGDINIERENFTFRFPLATCLIISILLTLLVNFFRK